MFYLDRFLFNKNIIRKAFPWIWIVGSIILTLIIYFTSNKIKLWPPDLTADGLSLMVEIFKIPLYYFVGCIPIYGIILTIERMKQTEERMKISEKQYSIMLNNNYYQHLKDFIEALSSTLERHVQNVRSASNFESKEAFCRIQHELWFGNVHTFELKVKESTHDIVKKLFDYIASIRIELDKNEGISSPDKEMLYEIRNLLSDLNIHFDNGIIHSIGRNAVDSQIQDTLKILIFVIKYSAMQVEIPRSIKKLAGY